MSRTEGITLPRLPAQHARATSPRAIQPHPAVSSSRDPANLGRTVFEPNYTAFVGSPRQDLPQHVYRDPAMFDDVFDKKGHLLLDRKTSKIGSPLNTLGYSSLHDSHCRKLFLSNKHIRSHLMNLGLITEDLKVVASTTEQRQKIRAHELLERREQLIQKLESKEQNRINRLEALLPIPSVYQRSARKDEERRERAKNIKMVKIEKKMKTEAKELQEKRKVQEETMKKVLLAMEEVSLLDQARRNAECVQQEMAEAIAYQKNYSRYGQRVASWHRDSDRIHNQMVAKARKGWPRKYHLQDLREADFAESDGSFSSPVEQLPSVVQSAVPTLPRIGDSTQADHITSHHPAVLNPDDYMTSHDPSPPVPSQAIDQLTYATSDTTKSVNMSRDFAATISDANQSTNHSTSNSDHKTISDDDQVTIPDDDHVSTSVDNHVKFITKNVSTEVEDQSSINSGRALATLESGGQSEGQFEVEIQPEVASNEVVILDSESAVSELIHLLLNGFTSVDTSGSGFITTESFINVLNSRDLGLQLNEEDIRYLVDLNNMYGNDQIPFMHVTPQLPAHLMTLYRSRAEHSLNTYGVYPEEEWCEIQMEQEKEVKVYFNKLSGVMMKGGRPENFRACLKDDVFEDAIVDFFEMADVDRDGVVDYSGFYSMLTSPVVSACVYSNQIETLLSHFVQSYGPDGQLSLDTFAPLARALLLMVYQNTYPGDEDWIQLESRKVGHFFFNKLTGESFFPTYEGDVPTNLHTVASLQEDDTALMEMKAKNTAKKKEHPHKVLWSDLPIPESGPPPLMRKSRKNRFNQKAEDAREEPDTNPSAEPLMNSALEHSNV